MSNFYTRMKAYREKFNLSQKELAERVNVRRETVVRLEQGQYNPSLRLAVDIAEEFQVQVEDIFVFAENEEEAARIFQRRDAQMLEAGYVDLYDQARQKGFEIGKSEAFLGMLTTMIEHVKIDMSEEKWIEEQKSIMECIGFPKEGWEDLCNFVKKYPELSARALARRVLRESEYKYI